MATWLAKSEPEVYSIDDLARDGATGWEGIRNYQARNHLRAMKVGDRVLFYHSNGEPPGVAGIAVVRKEHFPDPTQYDRDSAYFDAGSKPDDPRWSSVELRFVEKFAHFVPIGVLREDPALDGLEVTRKGSRLSLHPVSEAHYNRIVALGRDGLAGLTGRRES